MHLQPKGKELKQPFYSMTIRVMLAWLNSKKKITMKTKKKEEKKFLKLYKLVAVYWSTIDGPVELFLPSLTWRVCAQEFRYAYREF